MEMWAGAESMASNEHDEMQHGGFIERHMLSAWVQTYCDVTLLERKPRSCHVSDWEMVSDAHPLYDIHG